MGGCLSSQAADDLSLLNDSTGDGASLGPGDQPPPPTSAPPPPYQVLRGAGEGGKRRGGAADLVQLRGGGGQPLALRRLEGEEGKPAGWLAGDEDLGLVKLFAWELCRD